MIEAVCCHSESRGPRSGTGACCDESSWREQGNDFFGRDGNSQIDSQGLWAARDGVFVALRGGSLCTGHCRRRRTGDRTMVAATRVD
eukprot:5138756-Prymnesium_polylepis.1